MWIKHMSYVCGCVYLSYNVCVCVYDVWRHWAHRCDHLHTHTYCCCCYYYTQKYINNFTRKLSPHTLSPCPLALAHIDTHIQLEMQHNNRTARTVNYFDATMFGDFLTAAAEVLENSVTACASVSILAVLLKCACLRLAMLPTGCTQHENIVFCWNNYAAS